VERKDIDLGEQIVHHREDRLLDLSGKTRSSDHHSPFRDVEQHEGFASRVLDVRISLESRGMDNRPIRLELCESIGIELPDEHVASEQAVPRMFGDNAHLDAVAGIRSCVAVLDKHFTTLEIGAEAKPDQVEVTRLERFVDRAPPDVVLRGGLLDHELVVRRATRVSPGAHDERSEVTDLAFPPLHGLFVESGSRQVVVHRLQVREPGGR